MQHWQIAKPFYSNCGHRNTKLFMIDKLHMRVGLEPMTSLSAWHL